MRRLLVASVAAACLVLAGCGSNDSGGGLDDVTVSKAADPVVKVPKDLSVSKTTTRVLSEGAGDAIGTGETARLNYVAVNGRTGKQFDNSFTSDREMVLTYLETTALKGFLDSLTDQKVGTRLLVAIPPKDGFGTQGQSDLGIKADDTMVFLFDVVAKVPAPPTGKNAALPKDLPKLTLDADSHPVKFEKTGTSAAKQTKYSSNVLIKGKGKEVEAGQSVVAHYVGQVYSSLQVFDSSWERKAPSDFALVPDGLIKCWNDGLTGQTLGTRIVLVCPANVAYGNEPKGDVIKAGDTLIFSVDLLDAF